jgi:DNA-binding LacI/PurR family transcriptional regulator
MAGVSKQTVSRVVNGHSEVSDATRDMVLQVIAELNYHPSHAARVLRAGKSRRIGILAQDPALGGAVWNISAVEVAARRRGYWVTVASIDPDDY